LPQTPDPAALTLGQVATAHGVRGWLVVRSFAEPFDALLEYDEWQLRSPAGATRIVKLLEGAPYRDRLRVQLEGFIDRDQALAVSGWWIDIPRAELPQLSEREHYREDLLGFEVRNLEAVLLGKVDFFADLTSGPVMVVKGTGEHWVPANPQHLRKIDTAGRAIEVDWPVDEK
jgi:16S rRNA processing protein RimM